MSAMSRSVPGLILIVALTACDNSAKSTCTSDCITVTGKGTVINGSGMLKTEARPVPAFTAIRLADVDARVMIERTGRETLEVTADDNLVSLFTSDVRDGTLHLSVVKDRSMFGKRPVYRVTVGDLRQLGVSGGGIVDVRGLDGDSIAMSIAGSGEITASGRADDLAISISGSGSCDAGGLKAQRAKVALRGSGAATVDAQDELEAIVSGSGTVWYFGSPKITSSVSGSGAVKQRQEGVTAR
jgi:hypothetical protein